MTKADNYLQSEGQKPKVAEKAGGHSKTMTEAPQKSQPTNTI